MPHDTIPSAPALPAFKATSADKAETLAFAEAFSPRAHARSFTVGSAPIPTELRLIVEDFKRLKERLAATVIPGEPPYWRESVDVGGEKSDPFVALEVRRANRLLSERFDRQLLREHDIDVAAGRLAFGLLARTYGLERARKAVRAA